MEMTGGFQGDVRVRGGILNSRKPESKLVDSLLESSGVGRTTDQLDQWFDFDNAALSVPPELIPPSSPFSGQAGLHASSLQQRLPLGSIPGYNNGHHRHNLLGDHESSTSNMGTNLHVIGNRRKRSQDQIGFDDFLEMSDDGQPIKSSHSSPAYYDANSPDDSKTGRRFTTPPNPTPSGPWDAQYNFGTPHQSRPIAGPPRVNQRRPIPSALQTRPCAIPPPQPPSHPASGVHFSMHLPSTLSVDQIPTKSRVETQIPVKLHLFPFPPAVTKLHLPRHTISKPKLYAKPPTAKSADMLELHANLVCSSAMRTPHWLQNALARARGEDIRKEPSQRMEVTEGSSGDDSDESPHSENSSPEKSGPLSGGEVKICLGCMSRERKRAARKKVKKVKEEDEWRDDEAKRAVVFNNTEVREWMPISKSQYHGSLEGGMMVELHMRLACYCRHQGEKEGFRFVVLFITVFNRSLEYSNDFCRVIFTIKNHLDEVIAQQITSSILITDDHKSNSTMTTMAPGSHDIKILGVSQQGVYNTLHPNSNPFAHHHDNEQGFFTQANAISQPPQYSNSLHFDSSFGRNGIPVSPPPSGAQQSPQFSPSLGIPHTKKRRINSVTKVPANLAMTKLENPSASFQSSVPSQQQFFGAPYEMNNYNQSSSLAIQFQEPSTPSETNDSRRFSFDGAHVDNFRSQIDQSQFTSPRSAYASAVTSPSPHSTFVLQQPQQRHQTRQILPDIMQRNPERDAQITPEISRLIPGEGTTRGGIEVTVLGKGFVNGLTVLFGETPASQNLCYSSSTLICMLPPRSNPGPVVVTLRNLPLQKAPGHYPLFTYVDDTEKSLMELALQIVGIKMHGTMATAQDIARSIIENRGSTFGQGSSQTSESGGGGSQQHFIRRLAGEESLGGFGQIELEATLLKCLDAIDLDDSPHPARLNLRNKAGQTLLHLACILGMQRFVAALLARGALPNLRDKNGYTSMHFAALHNKPEIFKRLLLNKANASIQTKNGETPQDLAYKVTHGRLDQTSSRCHSRANSGSSEQRFNPRSRAGSSASLHSPWDSFSGANPTARGRPKPMGIDDFYNTSDEAVSSDTDDADVGDTWMRSRRSSLPGLGATAAAVSDISARDMVSIEAAQQVASGPGSAASRELGPSPSAMMAAWRENFAASLQNFQTHWNLPTMPTAAEFHQNIFQNLNPMAKFNALMPPFTQPWSAANPTPTQQDMKDGDYKWWELFTTPQAPPPYEELFPQPGVPSGPVGDTVLLRGPDVDEAKVQEPTVVASSPSSSASSLDMNELQRRIAKGGRDITREQQEEYRAHAAKMKKIENDRRLYFFWVSNLFSHIFPHVYTSTFEYWLINASFLY